MHIRRIEISDFRKIQHRKIEGLQDGLNIVVGDNEAGKSTMLAALRAVFFERHRVGGAVAESMLPYGGTLRPTVAVDFEIDGKAWSLTKAFCQRPEASLTGPGERIAGDAVEDRLAELFGFTPPGRGGSKPEEHQGTHGLLWVEQGTRINLGVGAGRDTLAAALEREVGQVTGGERGRALLAAAGERRDRFWDKRDKPRGEIVAQRKLVEELLREQDDLLARRRRYDEQIARLAAIEESLDRHRRDDRLNKAVVAVGTASRAMAEAEQRGSALKEADARFSEAERLTAEAKERRDHRAALVAKCAVARVAAEKSAIDAEETSTLARRRELALREAEARLKAARQTRETAEARGQAIEEALLRRRAQAGLTAQESTLAAAEAQMLQRREALARAEATTIDAETVTALVAAERAADRARAELEAASVQIAFEPDGVRQVTVDGVAYPPGELLSLARDAVLLLEGFGRLVLRPGGGTAALARKAEAAERVLRDALQRHGVPSVAEAQRALQARAAAQAEVASLTKAVAALAPQGIETLRQGVETERARLARPLGAAAAAFKDTADGLLLEDAKRSRNASRMVEQEAEQDMRAAAALHQTAATEAATLNERSAAAQRQERALAEELGGARTVADDDLLESRVTAAEASLAVARLGQESAHRALAAADPETARLVLERTERAEREIRRDLAALETERRDLQVELRAVGQDGIGERLTEIEGQLEASRAGLASAEREATASRLLHETLLIAQRESKDRWLGPVRRRVEPYLRLIHPDSEIRMDDRTLEIEGLVRDGVLESFGSLSMGAREQVAVITRLALADVLRAAGYPAAIILDDALVNTDETRLDRMHNVLTRAARTLQILIFTCRERDFLGLGATHRL
ncbi:AAA family ATPase [Lichenifustis flavocetrariae]|uniref:AAA family ATPase n=1 Tax=Lichenifustis flavocetrariae TaxID=2949735 RepID=A0AA41Z567_9HYPH|nr:AAA family ATPase [Lichenifustis flavocetrariae]MCW6510688.1 AAA family ATPase [Lichenifustis flavocetrariae]